MKRAAEFFKVSEKVYNQAGYERIRLPLRATAGSAGYDFFTPFDIALPPHGEAVVPTGVRVRMEEGVVLLCFPKSGLGFQYNLTLANTVGVIDSDYFYSDNEGHIIAKLKNGSDRPLLIEAGRAFMQGVFVPFFITESDRAEGRRNGGFGSTGGEKWEKM